MPLRRFALVPRVVHTWRRTRCLIWLQSYYIEQPSKFTALGSRPEVGRKYCEHIGRFGFEF